MPEAGWTSSDVPVYWDADLVPPHSGGISIEWYWGIAASLSEGPEPTQPGCTGIVDLVMSRNVGGQSRPHTASARGREPFALSEKPAFAGMTPQGYEPRW